jgi:hypothetical protein
MSKFKNSVLLFFLSKICLFSQVDESFLKHLSNYNIKTEHYYYIINECKNEDTLNYLLAKYYLQYKNDSLFFNHYYKSKTICLNDSNLINYSTIYFFKQNNFYCFQWLENLNTKVLSHSPQHEFINALYNEKKTKLDYGNNTFQSHFYEYKKTLNKKPWVSASLSALVPGLGKAYINSYRSFAITFFSNVLYGLQLNESIKNFGFKNPLTIANIALFGVFYSANIYGSYTETKKRKTEKLRQLLHDASDYFYIINNHNLYP